MQPAQSIPTKRTNTTIVVDKNTVLALRAKKIYPKESMNEVIKRLCKDAI